MREALAGVQSMIAEHIGDRFRPYSLDQIHATLIALNAVPGPRGEAVVNEYYLSHQGRSVEMDLAQVMEILVARFAAPLPARIGGHQRDRKVPFTSRGQHLFDRTFSLQGDAFVLVGWPVASLTGSARPLDDLRRDMNAAHLLHRYHARATDVDNDLHLVVGHLADTAGHTDAGGHTDEALRAADAVRAVCAVRAVREKLAADPVEVTISLSDVTIVAADSPTLAPALYVSGIPADETVLRTLMS